MNKITLISAVLALVSSMPAAAEPSSNVAFDAATRALLASGDPAKGKEVAANSKCKKCHSENGIAEDPDDPNLAGQLNSYLYKQLRDYQDKKRTKGGIELPDSVEIPTITGRVVAVSAQVDSDVDFPIQRYDKVLFNPKHAIPVDFEADNQLYVVPIEDLVAVFRKNEG